MPTEEKRKRGRPKGTTKKKHQPSGDELHNITQERDPSDMQILIRNHRRYAEHKKDRRKCLKCNQPIRYSSKTGVCELCLTRMQAASDREPSPGGPSRWWKLLKLKEKDVVEKYVLEKIFGTDLTYFHKGRDINRGIRWSGELLVEQEDGTYRRPRPGLGEWNCVRLHWVNTDGL